jgi:hypothetical protein
MMMITKFNGVVQSQVEQIAQAELVKQQIAVMVRKAVNHLKASFNQQPRLNLLFRRKLLISTILRLLTELTYLYQCNLHQMEPPKQMTHFLVVILDLNSLKLEPEPVIGNSHHLLMIIFG